MGCLLGCFSLFRFLPYHSTSVKNQRLAAIDIGSNSIKLAIVEAAASDSFTLILQERERVRLGQETLRNQMLSPDAISRSIEAINKFRQIAESKDCETVIAVATASVREADNSKEFVDEVLAKTGVTLDVLSPVEEARLIGIAAVQNVGMQKDALLNIDIGGGSTELSLMRDGVAEELFSLKLGAVGQTEKHLFSNPVKDKELKSLRNEISAALERPVRTLKKRKWKVTTGTSGTIINLAAMQNFQVSTAPSAALPEIVFKRLVALNQMVAKLPLEKRALLPSISLQRAEVIVAGGQILEGVMRELDIKTVRACTYALREGVIIDYLREVETESMPPVPDVEDYKLRGVFAIGRRFGYEEKHALQVANLAEKMFDQLAANYNLKRHQRTLLSAAALLHDVGFHVSHESHHRHTMYLIKNSELTGFSESEKMVIANIARYHRASFPKDKHPDFMALSERERDVVWKLGGILRLADGLDRSYESRVRDLKLMRGKRDWHLALVSDNPCEREIETCQRKKDMFDETFKCNLRITSNVH